MPSEQNSSLATPTLETFPTRREREARRAITNSSQDCRRQLRGEYVTRHTPTSYGARPRHLTLRRLEDSRKASTEPTRENCSRTTAHLHSTGRNTSILARSVASRRI